MTLTRRQRWIWKFWHAFWTVHYLLYWLVFEVFSLESDYADWYRARMEYEDQLRAVTHQAE